MNPTTTPTLLGVALLLAAASPAAASDPTVSVPDPSFAITGTQEFADALNANATAFKDEATTGATDYAAALQTSCPAPTPPEPPACNPPVPMTYLFGLPLLASGLVVNLTAAGTGFAGSGIQSNILAILTTKTDEGEAIVAAASDGIPSVGAALGDILDAVNQHLCDTEALPGSDPPTADGACGATTFVGQVRDGAGQVYTGVLGVVGAASLEPTCASFNAALDKVGPLPGNALPCSQLPDGADATALPLPAP